MCDSADLLPMTLVGAPISRREIITGVLFLTVHRKIGQDLWKKYRSITGMGSRDGKVFAGKDIQSDIGITCIVVIFRAAFGRIEIFCQFPFGQIK